MLYDPASTTETGGFDMVLSPVLNILGLLTTILAAAMLIPMCFDLYFGSPD